MALSRPEFDQAFDYLFVDEAGQVSIANVVAMGTSAKNIVLVVIRCNYRNRFRVLIPG